MIAELQTGFDLIEMQRQNIKAQVGALNAAQLAFRSAPDEWTVAQIVQHLVLADEEIGSAAKGVARLQ